MLYAYFAVLVKQCNLILFSLSPSPRAGGTGPDWGCTPSSASLSAFHLSPGLPRLISSAVRKLSMGSTGEDNFSLLLVTSPFPSHGALEDALGAGDNM